MINLANFIESNIFIIICVGVILISSLIVMVHVSAKNKEKRRRKQNTKELNDTLTMEILDEQNSQVVILPERTETAVEENTIKKEEPVVVIDKNENNTVDVVEEISTELEKNKENVELQIKEENTNITNIIDETVQKVETPQIEASKDEEEKENQIQIEEEIKPVYELNKEEDLVYAPIELNKEEAREVLDRLAIELAEKEEKKELENIEEEKNIELTNFEREQEENAIISLDELMEKGKELYNQNEVVGYDDEGDEPITIEQLQERWQKEKETINQIQIEEKIEEIESVKEEQTFVEPVENEEIVNNTTVIVPEKKEEELYQKVVKQVEFPSILSNRKEAYEAKFENSPIISPIYGIERKKFEEQEKLHPELVQAGNLEFENTANYEKFDEEIKKTNEFIAALKELQKKLD